MVYREPDELRTFREKSRQAVKLAMESRWEEAAALNRELIAEAPGDRDSFNRLGRALLELGDGQGARAAFEHSLTLDPGNGIARKNLERLTAGAADRGGGGTAVARKLFIGEAGKSAQVALIGCASGSARPYVAPGAELDLRTQNGNLLAFTCRGEYLGMVPPELGRRLVVMMEGGNQYDGAVVSTSDAVVHVLLHETYQHPSLRSKVSFPAASAVTEPAGAAPDADDEPEPPAAEPIEDDEPVDLLGLDPETLAKDGLAEVDVDDLIDDDDEVEEAPEEELEEAS